MLRLQVIPKEEGAWTPEAPAGVGVALVDDDGRRVAVGALVADVPDNVAVGERFSTSLRFVGQGVA